MNIAEFKVGLRSILAGENGILPEQMKAIMRHGSEAAQEHKSHPHYFAQEFGQPWFEAATICFGPLAAYAKATLLYDIVHQLYWEQGLPPQDKKVADVLCRLVEQLTFASHEKILVERLLSEYRVKSSFPMSGVILDRHVWLAMCKLAVVHAAPALAALEQ